LVCRCPDVTLQQTIHGRVERISLKSSFDDLALRFGEFEWQHGTNPSFIRLSMLSVAPLLSFMRFPRFTASAEGRPENSSSNQTLMSRTLHVVVIVKRNIFFREMGIA